MIVLCKLIFVAASIACIILLATKIAYLMNKNSNHIPFKESIDLVNLPIVTFTNNGIKLHFILDTGSDDSYIEASVISKLKGKLHTITKEIVTGGGIVVSNGFFTMDIYYKEQEYTNTFNVGNFKDTFKEIAGDTNIEIHGILGSNFFCEYQYVLDFDKLIAYSKR